MKQIIILTASCLFFVPALHAQTRLIASPAYDNVNYEHQAKQRSSPRNVAKFALMQKDEQKPIYRSLLSTNSDAINLTGHATTPYSKQEYLRIVHLKPVQTK